MSLMSVAEYVLWAVIGLLFWRRRLHRRFPAVGVYLALRVASTPVLFLIRSVQSQQWLNDDGHAIYFYSYWAFYIATAAVLFFVCTEVFRSMLSAFAGLSKFAILIFRWTMLASVIVTFSTMSFVHRGTLIIPDVALALMRSVTIVELSLLVFLCLSMKALRLSVRDVSFGIVLGLGLMSTSDIVAAWFLRYHFSMVSALQLIHESVILAALGIWAVYYALPERAGKPIVVPANSTIYRWNEIASALGHAGTHVAVWRPANGFFMNDVEKMVDKVLTQSLKSTKP